MTTEEKFNAAVNVIRSLPKNGSYQPSNELLLRFYGYFKQGTQGPCQGSRPAFWDLVGRAKYDAWKKLGDMPKNEAMAKYVDELHAIVETMSYSDKVANFLEAPTDELDSINFEDLELVAGDVLERVRSQPNSPIASRDASPNRFLEKLSSRSASPASEKSTEDSDHSDEEFIDTIESPEPTKKNIPNGLPVQPCEAPLINGVSNHVSRSRTRPHQTQIHAPSNTVDISQEVSGAIQSLKGDLEKLSRQVNTLESSRKAQKQRSWGLFGGVSPQLVALMIVWPFVASFIVNRWLVRRK